MSRYHDAVSKGSTPEPQVDDGRCFANGCPLSGAISELTKGGGPWFCRFHFGREPDLWPEITETVRETLREREPELAHARISEPADSGVF